MNTILGQTSSQIYPKLQKEHILRLSQKSVPTPQVIEFLLETMTGMFVKEVLQPENLITPRNFDPKDAILESASTPKPMRQITKKRIAIPKSPFISSGYIEDPTLRVWFYIDEQSQIQGPFTSLEMDHWFDNGFLFNELLIRLKENNDFVPLKQLFGKVEYYQVYVPSFGAGESTDQGVLSKGQLSSSSVQQGSVFTFGFDYTKQGSSPGKGGNFFSDADRDEENKSNIHGSLKSSNLTPNKKSPPRESQRKISGTPTNSIIRENNHVGFTKTEDSSRNLSFHGSLTANTSK